MALYFTQGTLNPASVSLARDIRQAWVSAFTGQAGWTILDDGYVNGTVERSVLVNSLGFAIMICNFTTLTTTKLFVYLGRSYNSTTHTMSNRTPSPFQTKPIDSNGFFIFDFNPPTLGGTIDNYDNYIIPTASQNAWSAHISSEQATLSVKTGGTNQGQWVHFGKATSLIDNPSITDSYPYFLTYSQTTAIAGNNFTTTALSCPGNENGLRTPDTGAYMSGFNTSVKTLPPASPTLYADKYSVTPTVGTLADFYIVRGVQSDPLNYLVGWLRAKMVDILSGSPTNAIYGDRIIIGAKTYMYIGGNGSGAGKAFQAGWAAIN